MSKYSLSKNVFFSVAKTFKSLSKNCQTVELTPTLFLASCHLKIKIQTVKANFKKVSEQTDQTLLKVFCSKLSSLQQTVKLTAKLSIQNIQKVRAAKNIFILCKLSRCDKLIKLY
jgi:hypothetical protein